MDGTIPRRAFSIGGAACRLLVVAFREFPAVSLGQTVEVNGTVEETFNAVTVEEEHGIGLAGNPYRTATRAGILER